MPNNNPETKHRVGEPAGKDDHFSLEVLEMGQEIQKTVIGSKDERNIPIEILETTIPAYSYNKKGEIEK